MGLLLFQERVVFEVIVREVRRQLLRLHWRVRIREVDVSVVLWVVDEVRVNCIVVPEVMILALIVVPVFASGVEEPTHPEEDYHHHPWTEEVEIRHPRA